MRWSPFLKAHSGAIAATDFFTVEVVTWRGLVRYFALFVIDLKTRRVEIAGLVASPSGLWMTQIDLSVSKTHPELSRRPIRGHQAAFVHV